MNIIEQSNEQVYLYDFTNERFQSFVANLESGCACYLWETLPNYDKIISHR